MLKKQPKANQMLHFWIEKIEKNSKISFFEKCFQMASSDSKWVPKYPLDPKTSFGSPHAPYGHIQNIFTKLSPFVSRWYNHKFDKGPRA